MADSKIKCTPTQHQTLSSFITFKAWIEVTTVIYLFIYFGVQLLCNVLVSVVQRCEAAICTHVPPSSWTSLPPPILPFQVLMEHLAELSLYQAAASPWLAVLYMAVQMRQSQFIPPSPTVSTRLFSTPVSLFLPSKQVYLYHFSRFYIYQLLQFFFFFLNRSIPQAEIKSMSRTASPWPASYTKNRHTSDQRGVSKQSPYFSLRPWAPLQFISQSFCQCHLICWRTAVHCTPLQPFGFLHGQCGTSSSVPDFCGLNILFFPWSI